VRAWVNATALLCSRPSSALSSNMGLMYFLSTMYKQGYPPKAQWGVDDMPDLTGRVVMVTGGYAGIGAEMVKASARSEMHYHVMRPCFECLRAPFRISLSHACLCEGCADIDGIYFFDERRLSSTTTARSTSLVGIAQRRRKPSQH
jgi:hypothetical protein